MNDVNQVPPVENKSIPGDSNPKTSCSADDVGEIDISEFMNPPNEHEIVNFVFHMIDVVMEQDNYFKVIYLQRETNHSYGNNVNS